MFNFFIPILFDIASTCGLCDTWHEQTMSIELGYAHQLVCMCKA